MINEFVRNISDVFPCDDLYNAIKDVEGDLRTFDPKYFNLELKKFAEISNNWKNAGYDDFSIQWYNFYSGKHFDSAFTDQFSQLMGAKPIKVWISKIMPGHCFPYHNDADEDESIYEGKNLVRYSLYIQDYKFGQIFILEDTPILGHKKGDVWRWRNHTVWHGGGNLGFDPKFIFNYLGETL